MTRSISNGNLQITVSEHGAELTSLLYCGKEYLWQADPRYWGRHSPVLFPIVGAVYENRFRIGSRQFSMNQHGFARDMDFVILSEKDDEIWFRLESSPDTLEKFPYRFILDIGYSISGSELKVMWKVTNPSPETIHFQIGAHPAFLFRGEAEGGIKGYFSVHTSGTPEYILISEKGCVATDKTYKAELEDGHYIAIGPETFSRDALIFENSQIERIELCCPDKKPYIRITADDVPVTGLWAPCADSPFVCIEPWYGRCDRAGYSGEFKDRDWMQHLGPGEVFNGGYTIECL